MVHKVGQILFIVPFPAAWVLTRALRAVWVLTRALRALHILLLFLQLKFLCLLVETGTDWMKLFLQPTRPVISESLFILLFYPVFLVSTL